MHNDLIKGMFTNKLGNPVARVIWAQKEQR